MDHVFDPRLCPDAVRAWSDPCGSRQFPFALDTLHEWMDGCPYVARAEGEWVVLESAVYGVDGLTVIGQNRLRFRQKLLGLDLTPGDTILFDHASIKGERRVRSAMKAAIRKRWGKRHLLDELMVHLIPRDKRMNHHTINDSIRMLAAEFRRRGWGSFDEAYEALKREMRSIERAA